jgi:hypothetical protein
MMVDGIAAREGRAMAPVAIKVLRCIRAIVMLLMN